MKDVCWQLGVNIAMFRRLGSLAFGVLALFVSSVALAGSGYDCALMSNFPGGGKSCSVGTGPVTAIVYSKQQAGLVAARWKRDLLQRLVKYGENWSGVTLDSDTRKELAKRLNANFKVSSSLVLDRVENDGTTYLILNGQMGVTLSDGAQLASAIEQAGQQSSMAQQAPISTPSRQAPAETKAVVTPVPTPTQTTTVSQANVWHVRLDIRDVSGMPVTGHATLNFASTELAVGQTPQVAIDGDHLETDIRVANGLSVLHGRLALDGTDVVPTDGGFVKRVRSMAVDFSRPASPTAVSAQSVSVVARRPVLTYLVNYAGLSEDQVYAATDLGSMLSEALAKRYHFTQFLGLNGYGRRVDKRYEMSYPESADQIDKEVSKLIDSVVVEAGPIPPQIGTGFEFCRTMDEGSCWVVYVAKHSYASLPTQKVIEQLRYLPKADERLLVLEVVDNTDDKPLFDQLTDRHLVVRVPDAWLDDGKAALKPLVAKVLSTLGVK